MTRSLVPFPNNSSTAAIAEVYTSTGFNAGDYVYYNGATGNYVNQATFSVPTATFNPAIPNPTALNGTYGTNLTNTNPTGRAAGSGVQKQAALLTNGNIVQIYVNKQNGLPYFQIVDNTLTTIVVASTVISATLLNTVFSNMGVIALTGGGFVAYWINDTGGTINYPCFAIYTNTGTVTLAAAQDTASGVAGFSNAMSISGVALPNGTFALAYSLAASIWFRGYSSVGVATYAWVNFIGFDSITTYGFGLAATSFNNIVITGRTATVNTMRYAMYNSSGVAVVASTTFTSTTTGGAVLYGMDATVLADGSTVVMAFLGLDLGLTSYQPTFVICPTTATTLTIGTERYIPIQNIGSGAGCQAGGNYSVLPLLSGNFVLTFLTQSGFQYQQQYAVFNSSGVCVSGFGTNTSSTGAGAHTFGQQTASSVSYKMGIVEIASLNTAYIYYMGDGATLSYAQYCAKLNTTNFTLNYTTAISQSVSSFTSTAGAPALSGAYPSAVAFAGTTTTARATFTPGTVVVPSTVVATGSAGSGSTYGLSITTFPNGNFAVAYTNSSFGILINIYTPTGAFIQTITTGFTLTAWSNNKCAVKICALSSGKLAVVWNENASDIKTALFSSSFVQIGTTQICPSACIASSAAVQGIGIAALTNDRYVVTYADGTYADRADVYVFGNTGTANIYANTTSVDISGSGGQCYNITIGGSSDGSFTVAVFDNATAQVKSNCFINSTGNTWLPSGMATGVSGAGSTSMNSMASTVTGRYYIPYAVGSGIRLGTSNRGSTFLQASATTAPVATYASGFATLIQSAVATTGYGTPAMAIQKTTTNTLSVYGMSAVTLGTTGPNTIVDTAIAMQTSSMLCATSGIGYNIVAAFLNASGEPSFAIVNAAPLLASEWVPVSPSSTSVPISIYPTATATTPAISNMTLAGIAVTTAAAGSTGQIQTNGLAQLNSSYSTTNIGAFDTTGLPVAGVKGTVNGRNVNMQGNT